MEKYKLNEKVRIFIDRSEADFDRACDAAYNRAVILFGIDENGHINRVEGANRSSSSLVVTFVGYECEGGLGGQSHAYEFKAKIVECEEE